MKINFRVNAFVLFISITTTVVCGVAQERKISDPYWTYEQRKMYYNEKMYQKRALAKKLREIETEQNKKRDAVRNAFKKRQAAQDAVVASEKKIIDDEHNRRLALLNEEHIQHLAVLNEATRQKQAVLDSEQRSKISEIDKEEQLLCSAAGKLSDAQILARLTEKPTPAQLQNQAKIMQAKNSNTVIFGKPVPRVNQVATRTVPAPQPRKPAAVAATVPAAAKPSRQPASTGYVIPTNIDDKDEGK